MSFVSRLWNAIRQPVRYIGSDLQGNKFYEAYSPNNAHRPKRTVQYNDPEDMWKYIGGGKRLAIQWSAWLSHTRQNPPTIEELQADMMRQQRVLDNVALIEARDRAEAEEMLRIRQSDAAQALQEAAVRNERVLPIAEIPTQPANDNVVPKPGAAPTSNLANESTPANNFDAAPTARHVLAKPVVLPPKFLTPTTPRKSRTTGKFSLPITDVQNDMSSTSLHSEQSQAPEPQETKTAPPPPMPSRPASDTESWTPKARRRG